MSIRYSNYEEYLENKQANEALDYLYNGKRETKRWPLQPSPPNAAMYLELSKILDTLDIETPNEFDENIEKNKIEENKIEEKREEIRDEVVLVTPQKKITKSNYTFCHLDPEYINLKKKFEGFDNERLISILVNSSDKNINYSNVYINRRIDKLTSSIILNERGIAPEFRDAKSGVTHKASESVEEMQESNDRQMIDMHWLYLNHQQDIKPTPWMKDFFAKKDFDYEEAEKFVSSARFATMKINRLGIPLDVQKLLLTLRSQVILKFQKEKREEIENLRLALINRSRTPTSRLKGANFEQDMIAFKCLLFAELSVKKAIEYWNTVPAHITSKVTPQLKPWMKSRLQLLKDLQVSEKGENLK